MSTEKAYIVLSQVPVVAERNKTIPFPSNACPVARRERVASWSGVCFRRTKAKGVDDAGTVVRVMHYVIKDVHRGAQKNGLNLQPWIVFRRATPRDYERH